MKDWERIRAEREDLTDYVIHFTRDRLWHDVVANGQTPKVPFVPFVPARDVLIEILDYGYIRPTYAPMNNQFCRDRRATVRGPDPAVCLTEQPLSAVVRMRALGIARRYSGYGIAYHKVALHSDGGRPVLYGTENEFGQLPLHLQYLWVNYKPVMPGCSDYPIDFTWDASGESNQERTVCRSC